ncbi:MAG: Fur family zinc uptake transcriptional regulator [Flavobacterium sp.]|jgi:Fur family zinc uptake transcriptional regulator
MTKTSSTRSVINHAEQQCKQRGTKLTEKRRQVLTGLVQSKKALSAYELIDYCRDKLGQQLPAMSVYRILEFLEEEDLVHRLNLAKKYVACSHISCDHAHEIPQFLVCNSCNAVEEISINRSVIRSLKDAVVDAGFHLARPQLEFECYCNDCGPQSDQASH